MARLQRHIPKLSVDYVVYNSDDVKIAIQAATQAADRTGQDMAIQQDLSVVPLAMAKEPPLEIIRCPMALRRPSRPVIYRTNSK